MIAVCCRTVRIGVGILRLAGFVLSAWPSWIWLKFFGPADEKQKRARWMQVMCRRALRILHCRVVTSGSVPGKGLVVANHLGYVDILALGSVMPCAFVAKMDVRKWPVFGWLAAMGGTVFVDRDSRASAARPLPAIEAILAAGVPVALFPEGTSSDGSHVLPFRTALLAVVERSDGTATAASIRYFGENGLPNRHLAYHGDDHFFTHLLAALAAHRTTVRLVFGVPVHGLDRKTLGLRLRAEIAANLTTPVDDKNLPRFSRRISGDTPRL